MINCMHDKPPSETKSKQADDVNRERVLQMLSLEYQALRDEVLVMSSGRFQFLGLMTTAAALLTTGLFSSSIFKNQIWIAAILAVAVLGFGVFNFLRLGRRRVAASVQVAAIEERINALVPAEPPYATVLSWESAHQDRDSFASRIGLGLDPRRSRVGRTAAEQPTSKKSDNHRLT